MCNVIGNDKITVISKEEGAELCSIKSKVDGTEYLWQADPSIWNRHAPVLFPIVGKLKDNKTIIEDREYTMGQHGFARDMTFKTIESSSDSVLYLLKSSNTTKEKYPYDFELYIGYKIVDTSIQVSYVVKNTDSKKMFFSLGAHPGFNCPLVDGEEFGDYYLEFNKPELINSINVKDALIEDVKTLLYADKVTKLQVSRGLFRNDAIILENMEATELSLKSTRNGHGVTVSYKGFPYLGIWSKQEDDGTFVCIEPWFGIADAVNSNGVFMEKKGIMELEAGDQFCCSSTISIF
jgi:galactose mutarotase-like enzyme